MTTKPLGNKPNLLNQQFGNLIVVAPQKVTKQGQHWLCKCCKCNRKQVVRTNRLFRLSNTTGCRSCSNLKNPCGDLTRTFWCQVEYAARLGKRKLEISMQEAWDIFLQQKRKCALTNITLILSPRKGVSTASLDRIDSHGDYTLDNVQWVHKDINRLKSDFPQDKFIQLCRLVADYHRF